jgi:DNA-binding protein H-NS
MLEVDSNHHSLSIIAQTSDTGSTGAMLANALDLASMSVDELWKLREEIEAIVAEKIAAEIIVLKRYLDRLSPKASVQRRSRKSSKPTEAERRPYPPVLPKYRNPEKPSETWTGRGRRPIWIHAQLSLGTHLEDLMVR